MRGLRGIAMLTAAGLLGVTGAGPATAHRIEIYDDASVSASMSGTVVATWHADPATCAAHGLCAFSGSVTQIANGGGDATISGRPGHAFISELDPDLPRAAVVRVRRDGQGGPG